MKSNEMIGGLMVAVTLASLVQGCMESGVGVAFWKIASAKKQ